jgi:tripartite ATP-independent transporter DctP family solute receptor
VKILFLYLFEITLRFFLKKLFRIRFLLFYILFLFNCTNSSYQPGEVKSKLTFRFATEVKPDNKVWDAARLVKENLEKGSVEDNIKEEEIKVEFYDQGMIGSDRSLLEACYFGVVEMVQVTSSVVTTIDPTFSLLDMPYLFVSEIHHKTVLDGEIGWEILNRLHRKNMQGLAFFSCGFRNLFYKGSHNEPPIRKPEDLHGKKIRVMESPIMVNSINALGASATPMPSSELFQALRTGVVDGAENNPRVFIADKYYEAGCTNFTFTEHFANQHVLIVNAKWFDSLEAKYRDRIRGVVRQIIPEYDDIWKKSVEEALVMMEKNGVRVTQIMDKQPFILRSEPVYQEFFRRYKSVPPSLLDRIRKAADR